MIQAFASAISETGSASGFSRTRPIAVITNGTTWATVVSVHSWLRRSIERSLTRGRQGTAASSGRGVPTGRVAASGSGSAMALPARDRAAHDHQLGLGGQLAHLGGLTLALRDHRD